MEPDWYVPLDELLQDFYEELGKNQGYEVLYDPDPFGIELEGLE